MRQFTGFRQLKPDVRWRQRRERAGTEGGGTGKGSTERCVRLPRPIVPVSAVDAGLGQKGALAWGTMGGVLLASSQGHGAGAIQPVLRGYDGRDRRHVGCTGGEFTSLLPWRWDSYPPYVLCLTTGWKNRSTRLFTVRVDLESQ